MRQARANLQKGSTEPGAVLHRSVAVSGLEVDMHVEITFNNGSTEQVPVSLEGNVVTRSGSWFPGHIVGEPRLCHFQSDYFGCALDEGGQRAGDVQPEEADIDPETRQPDWQGFRWKLVGDEADVCRDKLRKWADVLGPEFDPFKSGREYLHGNLLRTLSDDEARLYDSDQQCWCFYLDDPAAELANIRGEAEPSASGPRRV